jgi:hypothetical protein
LKLDPNRSATASAATPTTGVEAGGRRLELNLFSHIQYPEVADRALQLRMAEEELQYGQVAGLAIDLGSLRTPH